MKGCVKTTSVDDRSQLIVSYSARFGYVHDSREFKKTLKNMNSGIVDKFKIIIGDEGCDSEETTSSPKDVASPQ